MDMHLLNRTERRKVHTRLQLLNAAFELISEKSYADLTIKAITERADLGYGTFYLHFQDLDDIVWAVIHQITERVRAETEAKIAHLPYPVREYYSWVYMFEFAGETRQNIVDVFGRNGSAKLLQRYQEYLAKLHEENLRAGRYSAGLDLPPEFLAQSITGSLVRLIIWWAETPNDYTPQQMADMLYQAVYRQSPPRLDS
jgi:AcrR family transcriptional regulator